MCISIYMYCILPACLPAKASYHYKTHTHSTAKILGRCSHSCSRITVSTPKGIYYKFDFPFYSILTHISAQGAETVKGQPIQKPAILLAKACNTIQGTRHWTPTRTSVGESGNAVCS